VERAVRPLCALGLDVGHASTGNDDNNDIHAADLLVDFFEGQSHGVSFPNRHLLAGDTIVVHTDFPVSGSPTPSLIRAAAFAQSGSSIPIYEATGPFPGTFSLVILTPDEYLIQVEVLGSGAEVIFTISCTEGT
jgi:hypothetical protein